MDNFISRTRRQFDKAVRRLRGVDAITGLPDRDSFAAAIDRAAGQTTAVLICEIDRFKLIEERHDRRGIETIYRAIAHRLTEAVHCPALIARLEGPDFAIALRAPTDLETAIQISSRIQQAIAAPITIDGSDTYLTASVGFSLTPRVGSPRADDLLQAAQLALIEALRHAPSAIRNYSPSMQARVENRNTLTSQVGDALAKGEIRPFFQPQISTRTGAITGFETLARWQHPERGLIPPLEFLPALNQAGLMDQLGALMVRESLSALKRWDDMGFNVPRIGVNFSNEELRSPDLVARVAHELGRAGMSPDRLAVEVLENVVADSSEDIAVRNLTGLAALGCSLDLDDFGTGHASITTIRRYSIERIKIDRSFITRIDADIEQQQMVAAILTMAERLELDTLAEGVETAEERAMLARLGCGHVQGYGIARPLPPQEVDNWIAAYRAEVIGARGSKRKAG